MKLLDLVNTDAKAIVDDEDVSRLQGYQWKRLPMRPGGTGGYVYFLRPGGGSRTCYLHRFLFNEIAKGKVVDHLNGDVLDNRRVNLRVTTHHINHINMHRLRRNRVASGIRGVSFAPRRVGDVKPWYAQISAHNRTTNLGRYTTLEEATVVRHLAELKYFGELCPPIEGVACLQ
jgi:hypothetical protein